MADPERIELTQAARQHAGAPVLAARGVDARANITNVETDARPVADSDRRPRLTREDRLCRRRCRPPCAASRRSATRSSPRLGHLPRPARRRLPRLRRRRAAARRRCATTTKRRTSCCAARSCGWSRRSSTSRSAVGNHVDHHCAATSALRSSRSAGAGSCRRRASSVAPSSTRTSRTPGGTTSTAVGPGLARLDLPRGVAVEARLQRYQRGDRPQGRRPAGLRDTDPAPVRQRPGDARRPVRLPRARRAGRRRAAATPSATGRRLAI